MNGFRITLAAGVAAAMALLATPARADEARGFSLGVRTGYGVPFGAEKSGYTLASRDGGMIPFWLDLGYRINPNIYVGAFFQYGLTFPPQASCGPGASCSGDDLRGGIDAQFHFVPAEKFDPWVGIGLGYEVSRVFQSQGAGVSDTSLIDHGFQFDVQVGGDIRVSKLVPFGPFIDFSVGRFSKESTQDVNGNSSDVPMQSELHEWLIFGVRGQFNL